MTLRSQLAKAGRRGERMPLLDPCSQDLGVTPRRRRMSGQENVGGDVGGKREEGSGEGWERGRVRGG